MELYSIAFSLDRRLLNLKYLQQHIWCEKNPIARQRADKRGSRYRPDVNKNWRHRLWSDLYRVGSNYFIIGVWIMSKLCWLIIISHMSFGVELSPISYNLDRYIRLGSRIVSVQANKSLNMWRQICLQIYAIMLSIKSKIKIEYGS